MPNTPRHNFPLLNGPVAQPWDAYNTTIEAMDTLLKTNAELDALIAAAIGSHNHDDRYYTEAEVDAMSFTASRISDFNAAAMEAMEQTAREPVADVAALRAVAVADRTDKQVRLVEDKNFLYRFDAEGGGVDDGDGIIEPTVGTGRWFKVGVGTGNADTLDGQDGAFYLDYANFTGSFPEHDHSSSSEGGALSNALVTVEGAAPAAPAAGLIALYGLDDGFGAKRVYAKNAAGTVYDLTQTAITSWLGLNDVPNSYATFGGTFPMIARDASGVTFVTMASIALTDGATIATACAAIPRDGARFRVTLGGNRAFSEPTDVLDGMALTYYLTQDGTGGRNPTWWAGIKWRGGAAPDLSASAAASIAIVTFHYINGVWYGNYSKDYS
jgi:hypothetical protein